MLHCFAALAAVIARFRSRPYNKVIDLDEKRSFISHAAQRRLRARSGSNAPEPLEGKGGMAGRHRSRGGYEVVGPTDSYRFVSSTSRRPFLGARVERCGRRPPGRDIPGQVWSGGRVAGGGRRPGVACARGVWVGAGGEACGTWAAVGSSGHPGARVERRLSLALPLSLPPSLPLSCSHSNPNFLCHRPRRPGGCYDADDGHSYS